MKGTEFLEVFSGILYQLDNQHWEIELDYPEPHYDFSISCSLSGKKYSIGWIDPTRDYNEGYRRAVYEAYQMLFRFRRHFLKQELGHFPKSLADGGVV